MSAAIDLPDCWGVDTSCKITPEIAKKLAASKIPHDGVEHAIEFVWRYVHFGPALGGDVDADEVKRLEDEGLALLVVQHCRYFPWAASAKRGAEDGKHAVENAMAAGYLEGCSLAIDLEGVSNPGQAAIDHANAWAEVVEAGGYSPTDYIGFDSGMTADEHFALPKMHRYFGAAGAWNVSKRGLCCRQYPTTTIAGIPCDPDHAYPDAFGGTLRAMVGLCTAND
jgi:hypothetical protein